MTLVPRPERGLDIGETIGSTFAVAGRNIAAWAALAIVFYAVPMLILQSLILAPTVRVSAEAGMMLLRSYSWEPAVLTFAYVAAILLLYSAVTRGTIATLRGGRASLGDCFAAVVAALPPVLGLSVVAWLAAVGLGFLGDLIISGLIAALPFDYIEAAAWLAFLLLNIPFVIILVRWGVTVPAIVHERRSMLRAMGRSALLTKGSRWALFGLMVVLTMIVTLTQLVGVFAQALVGGTVGTGLGLVVDGVLWAVVATAFAVSYSALREAREGSGVEDLQEVFS
jgi:hypothetical protein